MNINFKNSLKIGINSALEAEECKKEIQSVFADFNVALNEETNGKVMVRIRRASNANALAVLGVFAKNNKVKNDDTEYYEAIFVKSVSSTGAEIEVARWRQAERGYPCWISLNHTEYACSDKESLISSLAKLASQPHFGKAVLEVMRRSD